MQQKGVTKVETNIYEEREKRARLRAALVIQRQIRSFNRLNECKKQMREDWAKFSYLPVDELFAKLRKFLFFYSPKNVDDQNKPNENGARNGHSLPMGHVD